MKNEEEENSLENRVDNLSLKELLAKAIKSEIEAAETYRNLLEKDLPEETKPRIEKMVAQEEEHEENFWNILKDFFPEEDIPLPERSEIEVPSDVSEDLTSEELVKKAMETERESEEFYRELAEEFEDEEIRRLLGFLASSEREHYHVLKEELEKLE